MKLSAFFAVAVLLATSAAPLTAHADGAIAVDRDGRAVVSFNYPGRRSAEDRALEDCGRGCLIATNFRRMCAAVASGERGGYGWATRDGLRRAEEAALEGCANQGGRHCRISARGCDERG